MNLNREIVSEAKWLGTMFNEIQLAMSLESSRRTRKQSDRNLL
jgi:hypothetical protein